MGRTSSGARAISSSPSSRWESAPGSYLGLVRTMTLATLQSDSDNRSSVPSADVFSCRADVSCIRPGFGGRNGMSIWVIVIVFLAGLFALSKIGDFVLERGSFWGFLLISIVVSGLLLALIETIT